MRTPGSAFLLLAFSTFALGAAPESLHGIDLRTQAPVTIPMGGPSSPYTVLAFLSSRCPCSSSHERPLDGLAREFGARGFRFIGIHSNQDEDRDESVRHFSQAGLTFPVLEDPGARIADRFGALKTPHVFVLDSRQKIVYQGGVDDSHVSAGAHVFYLRDALEALSQGKQPERAEARTLGCVISREARR